MMAIFRALLLSFAVGALLGLGTAVAAGDPLREGIDLYKQQRFDDAIKVLQTFISTNPSSAPAHYYIANCYLAVGKLDEADQSYQICLKFNPPADIASYAKKMHGQLQKRTAGGAEPGPPPTANPMEFNQQQFDDEVQKLKIRNHAKIIDTANAKISALLAQIDTLKKGLAADQVDDPLYFFRRGNRISNPGAQANQMAVQRKISDLEQQIFNIKNGARRDIEKMDAQMDSTFSELESQARSGSGNIKPVLTTRSVYVRDYVHFTGDEPPPEFVVTPLKLTAGKYIPPGGTTPKKP